VQFCGEGCSSAQGPSAPAPLGPGGALRCLLAIPLAAERELPDGTTVVIRSDLFATPISCPSPWPAMVFALHGDPRIALLAVFPDAAAAGALEASLPAGRSPCNPDLGAAERWVAGTNVLVLTSGDAVVASAVEKALRGEDHAADQFIAPPASRDQGARETLDAYLAARAAGLFQHAWGRFLPPAAAGSEVDPLAEPTLDAYDAWLSDVFRRYASNALEGEVTETGPADGQAIAADVAELVARDGGKDAVAFTVIHSNAKDPSLQTENFVVFRRSRGIPTEWVVVAPGP
jgi:hypothetical protein